ncbi:hypothetical protein BGZ83_006841, partial [Gryganskiella cystojenkinii]
MTRLSSKAKRACQQVISRYLETVSAEHLDEGDKIIPGFTPAFSDERIPAAKKGDAPNLKKGSNDGDSVASDNNQNSCSDFSRLFLSLPTMAALFER